MVNPVTKESLAARIADLESGARSLKEDYTLVAYKMLLATMEAEPVGYLFHNEYGAVLYSISDDATEGFSLIGPIYSVPQPAPVVPDEVKRCIEALAKLNNNLYRWTSRMSYNGSWVGEPEGLIKGHIREMEHILDSCRDVLRNQK